MGLVDKLSAQLHVRLHRAIDWGAHDGTLVSAAADSIQALIDAKVEEAVRAAEERMEKRFEEIFRARQDQQGA
jgi:hypothetical protein